MYQRKKDRMKFFFIFFLFFSSFVFSSQHSQKLIYPIKPNAFIYEDYIFGAKQADGLPILYSKSGKLIWTLPFDFDFKTVKIHFNKLFFIDSSQHLNVHGLKDTLKIFDNKLFKWKDYDLIYPHIVGLSEKGKIHCLNFNTGDLFWKSKQRYDDFYVVGHSSFLGARKGKKLDIINLFTAEVVGSVTLPSSQVTYLTAWNEGFVIYAKQFYFISMEPIQIETISIDKIENIKHFFYQNQAIILNKETLQLKKINMITEVTDWVANIDGDFKDFIISDDVIMFIYDQKIFRLYSLDNGNFLYSGKYIDDLVISFFKEKNSWYVLSDKSIQKAQTENLIIQDDEFTPLKLEPPL